MTDNNINKTLDLDVSLKMMAQKVGGLEHIPLAIRKAKEVAPELVLQILTGAKESVEDDQSPIDAKNRQIIYFTASLATNNKTCLDASFRKLLAMGTTKEELISIIKIVRQAASNAVLDASTSVLAAL